MTLLRLDIVGLWFKPPATKIIKDLPLNTPLRVIAEPDNPVDENAIAVWLPLGPLNLQSKEGMVPSSRWGILSQAVWLHFHDDSAWLDRIRPDAKVQAKTYEEFRQLDAFQLGYIPADIASGLVITSPTAGQLKWRDAFKARQQPKPQVEFSYGA